ncbi:MAG: sugar phosphate isomerase/epimerase [Verrucomicrobia bacterium]|nr:sugar phosphate isomerase/epimerase [Verrucomicrobiota bacterium]
MNNFSSACSRREFLRRSAAVAGGALATRHLPAAFAATKTTQIGAQLYTVRDACKADFAGALKKVAAIGYRAVQISGNYGKTAAEVKKMCDDNGLAILATHVGLDEFEKGVDPILSDHEVLKCRYIAIPFLPASRRKTKEDWLKLAALFEKWAQELKKRGFTLMYHNHAFEFEAKFDGKPALDLLYDNAPTLQAEPDLYWVAKGGADPVEFLKKFKNRAPVIHCKDMDKEDGSFAEVGYGKLDWDAILKVCKEIGAISYLVEQDKCKRDPFESLKMSLEFLKSKGLR